MLPALFEERGGNRLQRLLMLRYAPTPWIFSSAQSFSID